MLVKRLVSEMTNILVHITYMYVIVGLYFGLWEITFFLKAYCSIGPLHGPVTWYGINYAWTQVACTQWDFQNKGNSDKTGVSLFVFEDCPTV